MTYQIAFDNTGLATTTQVLKLAELMTARGYDVLAVLHSSSQNWETDCPCSDSEWLELLEMASAD